MNKLKHTMKILFLSFLVSLSMAGCQDKYPELEDGLYAEINTTKGTMVAKLFFEKTPVTVANFVGLAEGTHPKLPDTLKGKPFYNGIIFHRVMDNFMIQGGDPTGTGMGSAGYKFMSEFDKDLSHSKAGILSMANSGGYNTNGSQFFITESPRQNLDGFFQDGTLKNCNTPRTSCHTVFGELVLGLEVQDSISNVDVSKERATLNKPLVDVVINSVTIHRKGTSANMFDAVKVFNEEEPLLPQRLKELQKQQEEVARENSKEAANKFKEANKGSDIYESPTGLLMIHNKGKGAKPNSTQKVLIDCSGYFENGNLLYTTEAEVAKKMNQYNEQQDKAGAYKAFAMPYNESATLVAGFKEAMLRMNIGDKARVFIPSYLAYGASGRPPRVPPNTNLIFDIELKGIEK